VAIVKIVIDPSAAPELTPDEVVAKVNAAAAVIDRAGCVDAAARPIEDGEVTSGKLDTGVAKANLDAMAATARGYIKTDPTVGQFKITAIERKADGMIEIAFDDVAIPE
jgi:hypothetical protein